MLRTNATFYSSKKPDEKSVSRFCQLLLYITNRITPNELANIKLILEVDKHLSRTRVDTLTNMADLLRLLLSRNLIQENDLSLLTFLFRNIGQQDCDKRIQEYLNQTEIRSETVCSNKNSQQDNGTCLKSKPLAHGRGTSASQNRYSNQTIVKTMDDCSILSSLPETIEDISFCNSSDDEKNRLHEQPLKFPFDTKQRVIYVKTQTIRGGFGS